MAEIKDASGGLICGLDMAEERLSESEQMSRETSQSEVQRENGIQETTGKAAKNCEAVSKAVTSVKLGSHEEQKERESRISEIMMAENFQKLMTGTQFIPPNSGTWD